MLELRKSFTKAGKNFFHYSSVCTFFHMELGVVNFSDVNESAL